MMTSDSADEFVDKMSTLQMVADHQNEILDQVAAASQAAAQAQADAAQSAADAQATYDKVKDLIVAKQSTAKKAPAPKTPAKTK